MTTFDSNSLSTLSAIAGILNLTPSAVANWAKSDDFPAPALKVGRTQAWDTAAVIQWGLANGRIKAPSELRSLADAIEAAIAPDADEAPDVVADVEQGLADAAAGDVHDLGDFSEFVSVGPEEV